MFWAALSTVCTIAVGVWSFRQQQQALQLQTEAMDQERRLHKEALEQAKIHMETQLADAQKKFITSENNANDRHTDAAAQAKSLADRSLKVDEKGTGASIAQTAMAGAGVLAKGAAWASGVPL